MTKTRLTCALTAILLCVLLRSDDGRADCLACFELKSVQIRTRDGNRHAGYALWNPAWFTERERAKFPDALVSPGSWQYTPPRSLLLHTAVYRVKHPLPLLVTTSADTITIPISDIETIVPVSREHDGYPGASGLPVLSPTAIRWLSEEEPHAVLKEDSGVTDVYFLSFNEEIDGETLRRIRDGLKSLTPKEIAELEKKRVVYLSVAYD